MDNKMKKSKYAALVLASTMALSTVVTAAPQAFDNNAITAQAEEAATAISSNEAGTGITIDGKVYTIEYGTDTKTATLKNDTEEPISLEEGEKKIGEKTYTVTITLPVEGQDNKAGSVTLTEKTTTEPVTPTVPVVEATASAVDTAIEKLDFTAANYAASVTAAKTAYDALSEKDKKSVKKAKLLAGHVVISSDASKDLVEAIKKLPTEETLKTYTKYSTSVKGENTIATPDVVDEKDKKGKPVQRGVNTLLESAVDVLTTFDTEYKKISDSNAKNALKTTVAAVKKASATAKKQQTTVAGTYDAIKFNDAYNVLTKGGTYQVASDDKVKISKKGAFTVDGDKYQAVYEKGTITITDPSGESVLLRKADDAATAVDTFDIVNDDIPGVDDETPETTPETINSVTTDGVTTITVGGKTYQVIFNAADDEKEASVSFEGSDGIVNSYENNVPVEFPDNQVEYTLTFTDSEVTLVQKETDEATNESTNEATDEATTDNTYKIEYKDSAWKLTKIAEEVKIEEGGITLLNLDKKMDIKEYKKLKAGKGKYSDRQIEVIRSVESAYKAASSNGKKAIAKADVTTYKKYVADVKVQEALEKKMTAVSAKTVTTAIGALKWDTKKDLDASAYKKAVKEARLNYKKLSNKEKKKLKAATLTKLKGHEQALPVIEAILALPKANVASTDSDVKLNALKAAVNNIAVTVKTDKVKGGTGSYYDLPKAARGNVKNFKDIAAINKVITAQEAYFAKKADVDVFENKIAAISGTKTVRVVNNYVDLGDAIYSVAVDKKSKAATLTAEGKTDITVALNTTADYTPTANTAQTSSVAKASSADSTTSENGKVTLGGVEYTVVIAEDGTITLTTSGQETSNTVANDEITLGEVTYTVIKNDDSVTFTVKVAEGTNPSEPTPSVETSVGKYTITNAKGKISVTKVVADGGVEALPFKNVKIADFVKESEDKYTAAQKSDIEALNAATKVLAKDVSKQVDKADLAKAKAYAASLKKQEAFEKKIAADETKAKAIVDKATADIKDGKYALTGKDVTWTVKGEKPTAVANGATAPEQTATEQEITLVATAKSGVGSATKEFIVKIAAKTPETPAQTDVEKAQANVDAATAKIEDGKYVLTGTDVTWTVKENALSVVSGDDTPAATETEQTITLVASSTVGAETKTKEFTVTIEAKTAE